jgi:hypothetical protein
VPLAVSMSTRVSAPSAASCRHSSSPDIPGRSRSSTITSYRVTVAFSCPSTPVVRDVDRHAVTPQPPRDRVGQCRLVLHHQHPHASSLPEPAAVRLGPPSGSGGNTGVAAIRPMVHLSTGCYSIVTAPRTLTLPSRLPVPEHRAYVVAHNN